MNGLYLTLALLLGWTCWVPLSLYVTVATAAFAVSQTPRNTLALPSAWKVLLPDLSHGSYPHCLQVSV